MNNLLKVSALFLAVGLASCESKTSESTTTTPATTESTTTTTATADSSAATTTAPADGTMAPAAGDTTKKM